MDNQKKRRFAELRDIILKNLSTGQKTINQIASETGINWKTVDNHITFLIGKALAREVFSSRYVRIVEISEKGSDALNNGSGAGSSGPRSRFHRNGEVRMR